MCVCVLEREREREGERENLHVGCERMGRSGADAAANEDDTKRGSEACAFFRVLYDALRRDTIIWFFFFLGFFQDEWDQGPNHNKRSLALREIRPQ